MASILLEIVEHKRSEVAERKAAISQSSLEKGLEQGDGRFLKALQGEGLKLITEIKPSSPSAGVLREKIDIDSVLASYNQHANAISVLTDKKYFNGSLELMSDVVNKSPRPVLCKDFLLDEYQVYEARRAGAHAVLLIVKILDDDQLRSLHRTTLLLGMTPVVEVQTAEEVKRALSVSPQLVLINNRDLMTFEISLETTRALAPAIPAPILTVSASGVQNRADIESLLPCCKRFLVGSTLMQSDNLEAKLRELRGE